MFGVENVPQWMHPHEACPQCKERAEVGHRKLTMWLLENHSESKQVLAERMMKVFRVEVR